MSSQPPRSRFDPQEVFEIWAPPESVWSAWAKPVLFAHLGLEDDLARSGTGHAQAQVSWLEQGLDEPAAIVIDLPWAESVQWARSAIRYGYRPVPLFNTSPGPGAALELRGLMAALCDAVEDLRQANLEPAAPPAFLLDSHRLTSSKPLSPGVFDNRWVVFPQDFPSGEFLQSQSIRRVIVVRESPDIGDDLRDVLGRWQKSGLTLWLRPIGGYDGLTPLSVGGWRPRLRRFLAGLALGLRHNSAGGFGGVIPKPSSS